MAQLYGQVRTDWNQCFVIDCSLSQPAGHKPFTCSHSVVRNTWLNIHAVRWMCFSARLSVHVFATSRNNLTWSLFVSSAVSELSSDWSINCFLRYVCFCIVVKYKSLFVLMVDRCCRFASFKTSAELEAINCTVSPLNSPVSCLKQPRAWVTPSSSHRIAWIRFTVRACVLEWKTRQQYKEMEPVSIKRLAPYCRNVFAKKSVADRIAATMVCEHLWHVMASVIVENAVKPVGPDGLL